MVGDYMIVVDIKRIGLERRQRATILSLYRNVLSSLIERMQRDRGYAVRDANDRVTRSIIGHQELLGPLTGSA